MLDGLVIMYTGVITSFFPIWFRLLYFAVEQSGATFVKLGQWASTRRDLFSKEFCDLFSNLHIKVQPHAWSHTERTLAQSYGDKWQQLIHVLKQQDPIGSGCIAQVYKGYVSSKFVPESILKAVKEKDKLYCKEDDDISTILRALEGGDLGTREVIKDTVACDKTLIPVAIKVLHPNIREKFDRDLKLMKAASKVLTVLFPKLHWVNLNQCVEEFSVIMHKQLDMRYEFQCLQKFAKDFRSYTNIKVPQPIPAFVRHTILVETFEEGISMSVIVKSADYSLQLRKELASLGLEALLQMVFVNNFVHADLHPGNILVQNIEQYKPKKKVFFQGDVWDTVKMDPIDDFPLTLVLLDCGITASLSPDDRRKFRQVFTAVVKGEGETVADLFLSKSPINNCTDPELFRKEMAQLVAKGRKNLRRVSKIKVAELMNDLFTVLSRHKIQLDSSFATVILAIAMLEGLGRTLDPELNLMERARSVLLGSYLRKKKH